MRQKKEAPLPKELGKELDLAKMMKDSTHRYLMVSLLSDRARQLNGGSPALLKLEGPYSRLETAAAEAQAGLLKVVEREAEKAVVDLVEKT